MKQFQFTGTGTGAEPESNRKWCQFRNAQYCNIMSMYKTEVDPTQTALNQHVFKLLVVPSRYKRRSPSICLFCAFLLTSCGFKQCYA